LAALTFGQFCSIDYSLCLKRKLQLYFSSIILFKVLFGSSQILFVSSEIMKILMPAVAILHCYLKLKKNEKHSGDLSL